MTFDVSKEGGLRICFKLIWQQLVGVNKLGSIPHSSTNIELMKKILTNYVFKFLFENNLLANDGDLLECQGDLFIYDDENGNPGSLRYYFRQNGFWNYIKAKKGSVYCLERKVFLGESDRTSQGYLGLEYYKSSIRMATEEEKELYYFINRVKTN
jgi:hypothetical protein